MVVERSGKVAGLEGSPRLDLDLAEFEGWLQSNGRAEIGRKWGSWVHNHVWWPPGRDAGICTNVWRLRPVMASMGIVWNRERIRLRSSMRISITEIPVYRWFKELQNPCNAVQMHDNSGQMVGSGSLDNWAPKKNPFFRVWSRGTRKKWVCAKNSRKKKKRRWQTKKRKKKTSSTKTKTRMKLTTRGHAGKLFTRRGEAPKSVKKSQ